jgi:putative hydrolase
VDHEYREKAGAGQLRRIAPRRFNPTGAAWLPVLHTRRKNNHYTALYSNTARAHELGMSNDWVVVYRDDDGGQGQWTVITSRFGTMRGKRIIRGREAECAAYYKRAKEQDESAKPVPAKTLFETSANE